MMLPLLLLLARSPLKPPPDSVFGMWGVDTTFRAALRGDLVVRRVGASWQAKLATRWTRARPHGDTLRLSFGPAGELRANVGGSGITQAFWIQPPRRLTGVRYATPVVIRPAGAAAWSGRVRPLPDRWAIYMVVARDTTGAIRALVRNPVGDLGDGRFDVSVRGDSLRLLTGDSAAAVGILRAGRLRLSFAGLPPVELSRRDRGTAPGLFARPDTVYRYRPPPNAGDGLDVGTLPPSDSARLLSLARLASATDARRTGQPLVHSLLVSYRGKLVLEEYFFAYGASDPHDLRSASKSFVSLLAGAAGASPALTVGESFGAYRPFRHPEPRKDRITLADLLTMRSGLACDDNDATSPGSEDAMESQTAEPDWYRYTLDLPMAHSPGDTAVYCSAGINLAGGMLASRTHAWLPQLLDDAMLRPLGIRDYAVNLMPSGQAYMGGGIYMRPRDLMKIGQMVLNRGSWHGRRIVPSAWIDESTVARRGSGAASGDALMWHTNEVRAGARVYREIEANGNGGQLLMLVPDLDLAVVITAGNYNAYGIWRRFREDWLPAYILPRP